MTALKIIHSDSRGYEIEILEPSVNIHPLPFAPAAMEPKLVEGNWLIGVFAVWAFGAAESMALAIRLAQTYKDKFNLGLRAFDHHSENLRWWPTAAYPVGSRPATVLSKQGATLQIAAHPGNWILWLIMRNGAVLYEGAGSRTQKELEDLLNATKLFERQK